jgi:hypothetical protein
MADRGETLSTPSNPRLSAPTVARNGGWRGEGGWERSKRMRRIDDGPRLGLRNHQPAKGQHQRGGAQMEQPALDRIGRGVSTRSKARQHAAANARVAGPASCGASGSMAFFLFVASGSSRPGTRPRHAFPHHHFSTLLSRLVAHPG